MNREALARALENAFGPFLAHDPDKPDVFWPSMADSVIGTFALDADAVRREAAAEALEQAAAKLLDCYDVSGIDDGHRPHRYPKGAPAEVLAWCCEACGQTVREFGPRDTSRCPVDWRRNR